MTAMSQKPSETLMRDRSEVTDRLQTIAGPDFQVDGEGTGYRADTHPASTSGEGVYRWRIRVVGCHDEDDTDMLQNLKKALLGHGFSLPAGRPRGALLVNERAAFPERYDDALGPPPEVGLVAVAGSGETFVCWWAIFTDEFRWHRPGLQRVPTEGEGESWEDLWQRVGPLTVTGYQDVPAGFYD